MPTGTPINTLLFHDSPDMLIKHKAVSIEDAVLKRKRTYDSGSMIPQQAGQLIGYIHQMITANVISNAVVGKEIKSATGYGLYVMHSNGKCLLFKVTLSSEQLVVDTTVCFGINHKAAVLCRALNDLVSCHNNTNQH